MILYLLLGAIMVYLSWKDVKYREVSDISLIVLLLIVIFSQIDNLSEVSILFAILFTGIYLMSMLIMNIIYYYRKIVRKEKDIDSENLGFAIGEGDIIIIAALSCMFIYNGSINYLAVYLFIVLSIFLSMSYVGIRYLNDKTGESSRFVPMIPFIFLGFAIIHFTFL